MTARMLALDLRRGPAPLRGARRARARRRAPRAARCESAVLSLRQDACGSCSPACWPRASGTAAPRAGAASTRRSRAAPAPAWRRAAVEGGIDRPRRGRGARRCCSPRDRCWPAARSGPRWPRGRRRPSSRCRRRGVRRAGARARRRGAPMAAPAGAVPGARRHVGASAAGRPGTRAAMLLLPGGRRRRRAGPAHRPASRPRSCCGSRGLALSGWLLASGRLPLAALAPPPRAWPRLLALS